MSARVVVFDLGGVVVRVCRTWAEACARAGVEVRAPERFAEFELRERRSSLSDRYQSGAIACAEYFAGISAATDGLYTPEEVERVHRAWVMEDYPGMEAVITSLNDAGIVTACLSNTNRSHWEGLLGVSPACAAIARPLVSHELGAVKPEERIYRLAEERLGAAPGELVFFDDLEPNVSAARRYGWAAERIDHDSDTASQVRGHLEALGMYA
ncbi:MAG: hypothetical protein Tsb0013_24460 [Phycisphaerales bacterium]